jgi:hypothetical protein
MSHFSTLWLKLKAGSKRQEARGEEEEEEEGHRL